MQKKLYKLLFIAAILFAPWTMRGQFLETCHFNTGVDTSRWISMSTPTYVWNTYTDDAASSTMSLGFSFPLGGMSYTSFSVSSNGIFNLGGGATSGTQAGMFNSSYYTTALPKICGIARDLGTGYNGYVRYELIDPDPYADSDRVFVCEYAMGYTYGSDYVADVKWQVQLHENGGKIAIVYGPQTPSITPSDFHIGIGLASDDIMIINPSSHMPIYCNGAYANTFYTWPGAGRYYELTPSVITCPRPIAATVDSLTSSSCYFSWTDTTNTTEWLVRFSSSSLTFDTLVYDTSLNIYNLAANTEYTLSVAGVCGIDDTSLWRSVTFRTPCGSMSSLPFTEGFESAATGSSSSSNFVTCWGRLNNGSSYYGYPYVSSSSSYCHSGSRGLYWYNTTTTGTYGDYQCIVLPPVDTAVLPVNTLQLSFWAKTTSTSYNPVLYVGVLTNPDDINSFQTVGTVNVNNSTAWDQYTVELNTYTGNGQYIAIRANRPSTSWYIALDDVMLDYIPTCPAVDDLAARAITTTSARIQWDEQDTATAWNIEYGLSGFAIGTGTTLLAATDTITISGLTPNTSYDVYVMPVCADNRAGRVSVTFLTNCTGLDTLPFFENFESAPTGSSTSNAFINCWHRLNNGSSYFGYPYVSSSAIYSHNGGTRGLYWYNTTTTGTYGDYMCIVLPGADTALYPVNTLQLSFWARSSATSYNPTFDVGIMTDPNDYSTFQQVATINVGNSTAWGEYVTTFENYTGTGFFPAIRTTRASSSWYCYMDEIKLEVIPDCPHVQDLTATAITRTSALISWDEDGSATSWTVEYGTQGFTRGTGTTATASDDTLTISGLLSGTAYDVYVTPVCTGTAVENLIHFTTLCDFIDSIPYFEDFENVSSGSTTNNTFVPCWTRLNNGTMYFGYPYVANSSTYSHNGGSRGLYWYNTTTAATYGDYQYVVLPGVDPDLIPVNTLQLKFWAKASSTTYHPSFEIGVMTDPNEPSTFQAVSTFNVEGTDWQECFVPLTSYTGTGNFVAVRATRPTSSWYAYVDDFTLEQADPCANVYNMAVDNVGFLGAGITWATRGGTEEILNFDIMLTALDSNASDAPFTDMTTDLSYTFTSLIPGTQYMAKVRANCGSDLGEWDSIIFTTMFLPCAVFDSASLDTIIFSNSTSTGTSGIIVYSGYGNTVCQTIYTADELTTAGLSAGSIIGIDLGFSANSSYAKEFTIMMANTTKSTFSSSTDMENMVGHAVVYGPQPHPLNTSGWQHYEFDSPFEWDGTSNIIMTTFMNQPTGAAQTASSFNGYYTTGSGTRMAYRYQDNQPFTTSNYTGGSGGSTSSSRPSIHFYTGECLEYASCMPSIAWVSSNDSNGVELSWMASFNEDTWDIDYREIDSTEWHNAASGITDNSFLIQGLQDASRYEIRLSHLCNDSLYSTFVEAMTPGAYNMPISGSDTLVACRTIIYDNGGPEGSYSNSCDATIVIYPNDTTRTLRISGTFAGEGCCDYLGIYDGVGDSRRTLFYGYCTSSGTTMQIGPFTSERGALTITFHSDGSVVYPGFELRTACIPIPHCADLHYVKTEAVGTQAAKIKWLSDGNSRYGDPAGFEYILFDSLRNEIAHDTTTELSHFFTGLTIDSRYTVLVRTICPGDEQYGTWDSISFTTNGLPCVEFDTTLSRTVQFSNSTTTSSGVFVTSAWGNSYCQTIYTAEELNEAGMYAGLITGITLGYSSTGTYDKDFTIFLSTTNNSEFTSSSQSITIDSSMIVYGPAAHLSSVTGWVNYTFSEPFTWDGSSNLVLTTTMNQPAGASHSSSGFYAYATDCGETRTVYRYRDSSPWTITNYTSGNSSSSTYRPSITFQTTGCAASGSCAAPTVVIDSVGYDHIGIQWAPGYYEGSWQVAYQQAGDTTWVDLGTTSANSMNITGLTPDMNYNLRVTALCGDTNIHRRVSARTLCMPATLPLYEDFESWTASSTTPPPACWARLSNYSSGTYPYVSTSYSVYPGSKSLYFYSYSNTHSTIILPYFDTPLDSINLSFWLSRTNTSYDHSVRVGVMRDPTEFETFVEVGRATPTGPLYEFEPFEFTFENYHGTGKFIAISTTSDASYCYPYLDNIEVNYISSCRRVSGVNMISATLTTATVGWDTTDATTYDIEYGPTGYTRGTGTRINGIASDSITITGLNPGTEYDVYVRGNCGYDSSLWSFQYTLLTECLLIDSLPFADDLETWRTGNSQSARLHPCWTRLTDATTYYGYPYISNSSSYSHGGGSRGFYWYRSSSTGSYGSYNGIVLPGIDTTVIPMDTVELSFWARNSSSSYNSIFVVGVMTDPSDYSTFTPHDTVTGTGTDWTNVLVPFINYTGYGNYIGILTMYDGTYYYTYVDDFNLHYVPPCLLFNVRKDNSVRSSDTRLAVKWDDNGSGNYECVCVRSGMPIDSGIVVNTTVPNVIFNGLIPNTFYDIYVRSFCNTADTGRWATTTLQTDLCPSIDETIIGNINSSTTSYYAPVNNFYRYTLSETIIDASELANTSTIEYIGYYYNYTSPSTDKTNCTIYFQPTTKTSFTSEYDMVLLDTSIATMVYTGNLNCSQGWNLFTLNAPYQYSGTGNLLVIVDDNSGAYDGSSYTFRTSSTSAYKTLTWYSDSYNPDPTSTSFSGSKYNYQWRPLMRFVSCMPGCPAPYNVADSHDYHSATITWSGEGTDYEVNLKDSAATDWPSTDIQVLGNSRTFTNLQPATTYIFRVRQDCTADSLDYSDWTEYTFTTDSLDCYTPDSLYVTAVTNATATFDWTEQGGGTLWDLHVWFTGGLDSIYRLTSRPSTVGGFAAGLTYNAAIRPICGVDLFEGEWSDTITFTTAVCPNVTGLTASNVTANSVTLSWTANPMAQSWIIEYGYEGFDQGTGTTVPSANNTYVINGLTDDSPYDFYVRAVCGTNWVSENWALVNTRTQEGGVVCDAPTNVSTTVADNSVTVSWTAGTGNISYEIEYGIHGFGHGSGTTTNATTSPATIPNLEYETTYDLYVRAVCDQNTNSTWSTVATFTTGTRPSEDCNPVTNLTVSDITDTTATISWTPAPGTDSWHVVVTDQNGTDIIDAAHSTTTLMLSNLTPRTAYIVKVRTICDDGNYSAFVTTSFNTTGQGIDNAGNVACTIYPNPTSGSTTISVNGVNGKVKIDVVDMNGRVVATETLECNTDCAKTMDVDRLAQGAYFVRITGDTVNMVKKLIVR